MSNLMYTDQRILKENKARWKNVAMALIGDKKAYDIVPE